MTVITSGTPHLHRMLGEALRVHLTTEVRRSLVRTVIRRKLNTLAWDMAIVQ